ncbi:MAG: membrane dipeptidase [Chloroflexi bacterium]|nr:membrane dipeptidase [Chloroflexota bacterium]
MLAADSHLDLGWSSLQWNRDLELSAYTLRASESAMTEKGRGQNTVCLPEMRRGRVALAFTTVLARSTGIKNPHIDYGSPAQAHAIGMSHIAYYRALERLGHVRVITDLAALNRHIKEWESWDAAHKQPTDATPPLGFVISMESADPILSPGELGQWAEAGLRIIGPAHYGPGRYAGGTGTELGLSKIGVELVRKMDRLGLILDMTHFSDQAFWQAADIFKGPVLASHNNCRALVPHQRQFSDEQLKWIIARGGVIGAAFDIWMLIPEFNRGATTNRQASIATVCDHIDHVCQLAGSARHAAIGSDLDGGFGREQAPHDLDTIADLQKVGEILSGRGYSQSDVAAIMYGNWVRLLREAWGAKAAKAPARKAGAGTRKSR